MTGRRSSHVQLVALGTVLIGACSNQNIPKDRYVYKAQQECVQDWGDSTCQRAPVGHGSSAGYWFGPRFNSIAETPSGKHIWTGTQSQPAIHPLSGEALGSKAVNVSRGGFGSSARSIGSSSS